MRYIFYKIYEDIIAYTLVGLKENNVYEETPLLNTSH